MDWSQVNWFKLEWKDPPRTTTKQEWKKVSSWLRFVRREIKSKIDPEAIMQAMKDLTVYGIGGCKIDNSGKMQKSYLTELTQML